MTATMAYNFGNDPPKVSKLAEFYEGIGKQKSFKVPGFAEVVIKRVKQQHSNVSAFVDMFEKRVKQQSRNAQVNRTKSCYVTYEKRYRLEDNAVNNLADVQRKQQYHRSCSLVRSSNGAAVSSNEMKNSVVAKENVKLCFGSSVMEHAEVKLPERNEKVKLGFADTVSESVKGKPVESKEDFNFVDTVSVYPEETPVEANEKDNFCFGGAFTDDSERDETTNENVSLCFGSSVTEDSHEEPVEATENVELSFVDTVTKDSEEKPDEAKENVNTSVIEESEEKPDNVNTSLMEPDETKENVSTCVIEDVEEKPVEANEKLSFNHLIYARKGHWREKDGKPFSLDELQQPLALTGVLFVKPLAPANSISTLLSKVSSCSLIELTLHNQTLPFGDFKVLTEGGTIRKLKFLAVIIKDEDGALVTFDNIMKELPLIETITYDVVSTKVDCSITRETAHLLCELPVFENLQCLEMFHVPRWFDVESYCVFMEDHSRAQYALHFVLDSSLNRTKIKSLIQSCTFLDRLPAINFN